MFNSIFFIDLTYNYSELFVLYLYRYIRDVQVFVNNWLDDNQVHICIFYLYDETIGF